MPLASESNEGIARYFRYRLGGLFGRLGITSHLLLAFAAVAALVLAANRIAQHGTLIVRVTEATHLAPTIPAPSPAPPAPAEASTPKSGEPIPSPLAQLPLTDTLDRFDGDVLSRVDENTPERTRLLERDAQALRTESMALTKAAAGQRRSRPSSQWVAHVAAHQRKAIRLISLADTRRQLIVQSGQHFDALDAQITNALDGAWKIFGRVITRQSLVAVSRQLDPLRRDLTRMAIPGEHEQSDGQATLLRLAAFERLLQQSESSLLRSQGGSMGRTFTGPRYPTISR